MNLVSLLNESAETENPFFSWDVRHNAEGAVRVEAATSQCFSDRDEAYGAASRLLDAVATTEEIEGLNACDGWVGAGFDSDMNAWRGQIDLAFNTA